MGSQPRRDRITNLLCDIVARPWIVAREGLKPTRVFDLEMTDIPVRQINYFISGNLTSHGESGLVEPSATSGFGVSSRAVIGYDLKFITTLQGFSHRHPVFQLLLGNFAGRLFAKFSMSRFRPNKFSAEFCNENSSTTRLRNPELFRVQNVRFGGVSHSDQNTSELLPNRQYCGNLFQDDHVKRLVRVARSECPFQRFENQACSFITQSRNVVLNLSVAFSHALGIGQDLFQRITAGPSSCDRIGLARRTTREDSNLAVVARGPKVVLRITQAHIGLDCAETGCFSSRTCVVVELDTSSPHTQPVCADIEPTRPREKVDHLDMLGGRRLRRHAQDLSRPYRHRCNAHAMP